MAKKKNLSPEDIMRGVIDNAFKAQDKDKKWTKKEIAGIFSVDPLKQTAVQRHLMIASAIFVQNNITPEDYKVLYDIAKDNEFVRLLPFGLLFRSPDDYTDKDDEDWDDEDWDDEDWDDEDWDDEDWDDDEDEDSGFNGRRGAFGRQGVTGFPMRDADKKTLLLKIQLRGVTKPPLWREVRVPAKFNFQQLHEIIQILFGWTDSHLWQFEPKAYGDDFTIGPEMDDNDFDDGPSDIAAKTAITTVLKQAGDKIVYTYDFGDDWIHDITVKEVIEEASEHAVCTKWKGDNPMEDIGGTWGLDELRQMADPKIKHTKKEIKEFLDDYMYESIEDFREAMEELKFDEPYVNDELKCI